MEPQAALEQRRPAARADALDELAWQAAFSAPGEAARELIILDDVHAYRAGL